MSKPVLVTVAMLIGILAGFLYWGLPTKSLHTELGDSRNADRLEAELGELRTANQRLQAELENATSDLRREKEMNSRLHLLVSQGKK